jgi:lia operon protein LiaG
MKLNKLIIAAVIIYSTSNYVVAQEYKIPAENTKDGKLSVVNFPGDLPVEGYNGKDIIISIDGDESNATPERAKGLKPVYSGGTDNTGLGLSVEKNGNQVTVTCLLPITRRNDYKIKMPENMAFKYQSGCERAGEVNIRGIKNEIEIKTCQSVTLKDISGPAVVSTISGNIDVIFTEIPSNNPCSLSSISGEVDVTLPVKTAANLEMKSISGAIYSDFDFPSAPATDKNMKRYGGGNNISHKLNGGGFDLSLVSVSGNVYLRKGK